MRSLFTNTKPVVNVPVITKPVINAPVKVDTPPLLSKPETKVITHAVIKNCASITMSKTGVRSSVPLTYAFGECNDIQIEPRDEVDQYLCESKETYQLIIPNVVFHVSSMHVKCTYSLTLNDDVVDARSFLLEVSGQSDVWFPLGQTFQRLDVHQRGSGTVNINHCTAERMDALVIGVGNVVNFTARKQLWSCKFGVGGTIQGDMCPGCNITGDTIATVF